MSHLLLLIALLPGVTRDTSVPSLTPDKALAQFVVDQWTGEDGLPQHTVRAIHQSDSGYLWLATQSGLVRFDGRDFWVYDTDPAFRSIRIIALAEDEAGTLWIGTHDGIVLIDGTTATPLGHLPPKTQVGALAPTEQGMLVGTWNSGVFLCSATECDKVGNADSLGFQEVQSILSLPTGAMLGTDAGLFRLSGAGLELIEGTATIQVSDLALRHDGTIFIASRERGVHRLAGNQVERLLPADGWPDERVFSMYTDESDNLWLTTDSGGLMRVSFADGRQHDLLEDLPGTRAIAIHEDREGSVWIGTEGGGLLRLRDGPFTTIGGSAGLSADYVTTLFEDANGNLLAGTFGGGVNRLDATRLRATSVMEGLPSDNVTGVIGAPNGGLWVASIDAGVSLVRNGVVRAVQGLPSNSVYALHVDAQGELWVGTDQGLAHVSDRQTKVITVDQGLASNSIVDIEDDGMGRVWVGTYGGGLTQIAADGSKQTFTSQEGLGSDIVTALHYDSDGVLWIGTIEGGLNTLIDGQLASYSVKDGLFDRTIYQIIEDDHGYLWMGSNKGVARVAKAAIRGYARGESAVIVHESFGSDDGLKSPEINGGAQPAGWKGRDGRIWFPTVAGVAVVDPGDLSRNTVPPPLVIERVEADGVLVRSLTELAFPAGTRRIEFKFVALSLVDGEAVRYRYRLHGEEEDWNTTMAGNTATYTFLDPGSYTFHVTGANNDGVWNEDGASLSFTLRPYFWQTRWFWLLVASVSFVAGALFFRARTRQLKLQRIELERMVQARTRDVMAAKDQIQAQSDALRSSLREKEVLLREVHHRVKNNLQMISSLLQLQSRQVDDPATKLRFDECRDRIYSFSMVHERLYMAKDMAQFDFVDYLRGLVDQLVRSHERSDRAIHLSVDVERRPMEVDRAIPCGLIVTEFVTNALRHAFDDRSNGSISVIFRHEGNDAVLSVEDDGLGLADDFLAQRRDGLGLKLVEALVGRLKGRIDVSQREVGGVRCEVRFPLGDSVLQSPEPVEAEVA